MDRWTRLTCPAPVHVNPASLLCSNMSWVRPAQVLQAIQAIQAINLVDPVAVRWAGPTDRLAARTNFRSNACASLGFLFRLEGGNFGGRQETTTWPAWS